VVLSDFSLHSPRRRSFCNLQDYFVSKQINPPGEESWRNISIGAMDGDCG